MKIAIRAFIILFITHNFLSTKANALPIDWEGAFGVNTTLINNYRKIKQVNVNTTEASSNGGTQEVGLARGIQANASFQEYVFRLSPNIIINDSVTVKGELASDYARGGRLGDDSNRSQKGNMANALYNLNTSTGNNSIIVNKIYAEYFSDAGTYQIGRHSVHWGLGAIHHSGEDLWDRYISTRDGITMMYKLGNFSISPFIGKYGSSESLTKSTKTKEMGASLLYNNYGNDFTFGLYYSKKENKAFNGTLKADLSGDETNNPTSLGETNVKLTDFYFKKAFGKFDVSGEVILANGKLGHLYNEETKVNYKGKAFLFETGYKLNSNWGLSLDLGHISGDDGGSSSFDALYLNPNFQIAHLLFNYNLRGISDTSYNINDSYMTNTRYLKLGGHYRADTWSFEAALIYAKANEAAKAGKLAFNHENNKQFNAVEDQSEDLGMEIDTSLVYNWNRETEIGVDFGYHFVGDYFAFDNDTSTKNTTDDSFILKIFTGIKF